MNVDQKTLGTIRAYVMVGVVIGSIVLTASVSAFIPSIGPGDADRALGIAKSSLATRYAFNNSYFVIGVLNGLERAQRQVDLAKFD